jgi:immunity protein 8 of polymorphic toxin system
MFGPEGGQGEEAFDILVCTPDWIAREVEHGGIVNGRHHLIVRKFDLSLITSFLLEAANNSTARTWQEAAAKLSRIGKWEFEDYKP